MYNFDGGCEPYLDFQISLSCWFFFPPVKGKTVVLAGKGMVSQSAEAPLITNFGPIDRMAAVNISIETPSMKMISSLFLLLESRLYVDKCIGAVHLLTVRIQNSFWY